jgi:2-dehydropantoate 2-reductase
VIGSVYAGKLLQAGHEVILFARGHRLSDLRAHGLILEDALSGQRIEISVPSVGELASDERYDLVLVSVRSEQPASTLPNLLKMCDDSDTLFLGNTTGQQRGLVATLGERALFGFPAVGGVRDGPVVRYVLIGQQKTMLGEANHTTTPRVQQLQEVLRNVGFPTRISVNING